jgi:outer membrane protein OmpA-like peptidoglycan-associated protein
LSERRAQSVANYLTSHGVARARIATRGYGETAPLCMPDDTEAKRAANRRVEIKIVPVREGDVG